MAPTSIAISARQIPLLRTNPLIAQSGENVRTEEHPAGTPAARTVMDTKIRGLTTAAIQPLPTGAALLHLLLTQSQHLLLEQPP